MLSPKKAHKLIVERTGCNITLQTVYNWIKCGKILSKSLGGKKLIALSDLEFFLSDFTAADKQSVGEGSL